MFEINFLCELLVRPSESISIQTGCIELARKKKESVPSDETRFCKIGNDGRSWRVAVQVQSEIHQFKLESRDPV